MKIAAVLMILPLMLLTSCGGSADNSSATSGPVKAVAPPVGSDWTTTVTLTPDYGMRMGNPDAPIKLIEYASLTCPHCAEFSEKAAATLRDKYVASGKLSWELRNYVRDPVDVTATLLARCGGPAPFFPLAEQMYADQKNWFPKVQSLTQADVQAIGALPPAQQFVRFGAITGLTDFVRQRGISGPKAAACLADTKAVDTLLTIQKQANDKYNIPGTPTFVINGQVVPETATWEALEPKLKAAGV